MVGISNLMGDKLEGCGFDNGDLWRHSLAVGFGAQFLADRVEPHLSNDAFIAGLIHDAGKIVLDEYVLERKDEVETFRADGDQTFLDVEKKLLGNQLKQSPKNSRIFDISPLKSPPPPSHQ